MSRDYAMEEVIEQQMRAKEAHDRLTAYCAKLKRSLAEAVLLLREHARTVGPQHSWWDFVSEAEDLLKEEW